MNQLQNLHTHTTFCDGKNTPEEIVRYAMEHGFSSIGFSGHVYTDFDLSYCMQDMRGYLEEINRLKELYRGTFPIYLGIEEDVYAQVDRSQYDYVIGSSHYIKKGDKYYSVDHSRECFQKCFATYDHDVSALAEDYFRTFAAYIKARRPDVIGHFDLITKFDEIDGHGFLQNKVYTAVAEAYLKEILKLDCVFEVNTGAISRGYRTTPYPSEHLLYMICKHGGKITLSADSHSIDTLDFGFRKTKDWLWDIGFRELYVWSEGTFIKCAIRE